MMATFLFFAAIVLVPLLTGFGLWCHPELQSLTRSARLAAVYLVGLVLAATLATLLSALGITWRLWPAGLVGLAALAVSRHQEAGIKVDWAAPDRLGSRFGLVAVMVLGVLYGAAACLSGAATSVDYVMHWGVKGVHFALRQGIDFDLLSRPFLAHTHITYPPLWPTLLAWGTMAAGEMPWAAGPWLSLLGLTAATPLVLNLLRVRIRQHARTVTAFWFLAMTANLVVSYSGGNAAIALLVFETVAVLAFLAETRPARGTFRWLAAAALAGAVLTKNEGAIAVVLILAGVVVRGLIEREPRLWRRTAAVAAPALLVFGLWLLTRLHHGLPLTDPVREQVFALNLHQPVLILKLCIRNLGAGTWGLSWLLPLGLLLVAQGWRRLISVLPALVLSAGLLAFAFFFYLHIQGDPMPTINWTLSRLSLPALSAWILAVGVACFADPGTARNGGWQQDMRE